jgi:hypothetical protein
VAGCYHYGKELPGPIKNITSFKNIFLKFNLKSITRIPLQNSVHINKDRLSHLASLFTSVTTLNPP